MHQSSTSPNRAASERVLVVEDSGETRRFVADVLHSAGYQVVECAAAEAGLHQVAAELPDLIITDVQMPDLNGTELVARLREQGCDRPVILMTAYGSEALAVQALRLGVRDYLIKPFRADDLLAAVEQALNENRLRRERDELTRRLLATNEQLQQANDRLKRQLQEINTLVSIGKSVTAVLDLQQVLNRVVEAAVYISGAEEGSLFLPDPVSGELYVRAARNLDDRVVRELRLPVHDTIPGDVLRSGEPILLSHTALTKIKTAYLVRAAVYVPLKLKNRTIGVLGVDNRSSDRSFSKRDAQVLSALADYAAVAIENARLFEANEAERSKLEAILGHTEDAVVVVDLQGRVVLCNDAARQAFGIAPGPVAGQPLDSIVQHPDLLKLFQLQHSATPQLPGIGSRRTEIHVRDERVLNVHLTAIEAVGLAAVMQDITHLKKLDQVKSEFVATVSHDLRSPLTAILGYVNLLSRAGPLNEMQTEFVRRVEQSIHTITDLINELLDLGRIEGGFDQDMEPCHVSRLVRDVLEAFYPQAAAKSVTIQLDLLPHLPPITANPLRLRQVISNLADNAVKYTPAGGRITIRLTAEADVIVLQVIDTGIGIPMAEQPYIFDRFFRSEQVADQVAGSGLGLSIVKSIVEAHQGRIWVESQPNQGSTFTVMLPKNMPEQA